MTAAGQAARRDFRALLAARWDQGLFVSVGLDPDWERLPAHLRAGACAAAGPEPDDAAKAAAVLAFCTAVVDATADLACAFKPNAAFFERFGACGVAALGSLMRHIRAAAPAVPVIYDAKRGDIGSTNAGYVEDGFDRLGADAITVHPYLGAESLAPFLDRADRGVIVLVRTSNPGGGEFQDLRVGGGTGSDPGGEPLYRAVARRVAEGWNRNGNCAVVVGATYPAELAAVRAIVGDMPILIPGVGAQGGDVRATVEAGRDARGRGMVINSSRGIIYASASEDFAEAARAETLRLTREIQGFNR